MSKKRFIRVLDATLRDGCHPLQHQYRADTIARFASLLDQAHIDTLEIAHGDGLGGSSLHFGHSLLSDQEAISTAKAVVKRTRLAALLLPGVGRLDELRIAQEAGATTARIATQSTEANIAERYLHTVKEMGMEAFGFLMLSSMASPEQLLEQAKKMEAYGADAVYVVDSAGAMHIDEIRAKVSLLKKHLSVQIGFHGHNNLGLAVGNTVAAIEEGADLVDGCLAGFGAGAGNAPTEVLVALLDKMGYETGVDMSIVLQAAEELLRTVMPRPQSIEKGAISLGIAGIHASTLFTTLPLLGKYGVDAREIFSELIVRRLDGAYFETLANDVLNKQIESFEVHISMINKQSGPSFH